jgi:hypothetical protein
MFMDGQIELNIKYDKATLYDELIDVCPLLQRKISKIIFKKWIDKWAEARGFEAIHSASNGQHLVVFVVK